MFCTPNRSTCTAGDLAVLQSYPTVHESGTIDSVPKAIISRIDSNASGRPKRIYQRCDSMPVESQTEPIFPSLSASETIRSITSAWQILSDVLIYQHSDIGQGRGFRGCQIFVKFPPPLVFAWAQFFMPTPRSLLFGERASCCFTYRLPSRSARGGNSVDHQITPFPKETLCIERLLWDMLCVNGQDVATCFNIIGPQARLFW